MTQKPEIQGALVELAGQLLPIWARHLATSRAHSEAAVTEMLMAFSAFGPYLQKTMAETQTLKEAITPAGGEQGLSTLAQACERELAPIMSALQPAQAQAVSRVLELIRDVTASVAQAAQPLAQGAEEVAEKIDRMYVGFQYQDRVDQMMALLEGDMTRLQEALESPDSTAETLSAVPWLERLQSLYAMAEQRRDHGKGDAHADSNNETSFF